VSVAFPYRLLQLTSSSDIGGTEQMLLRLLSKLNREKFTVCICSLIGHGRLTEACKRLGYEAWNLKFTSPLHIDKVIWLYRLCRSERIQLIHAYGLRADTVGRFVAHVSGVPVIVSSIRGPDEQRRWFHVWLDRLTARWVDLFISNSEAGRKSRIRRERFAPEKIVTILNGIEFPLPASPADVHALREKYGVSEDAYPIVGIIANVRPMKGHRDVIAALPALRSRFPRICMLCVGRDDSGGEIQRTAKERGVLESMKFLGYQEATQEILALSTVFLLPSYWEGCPASILEAMAAGVPVVATRVGGIPEIVEDHKTGLLIPPKDPDAICQAIIWISENPREVEVMVRGAKQQVAERFSLERMVSNIEETYERLLKKKITSS
jgi:glycosyltransferase involved in cell wall biosynthesis